MAKRGPKPREKRPVKFGVTVYLIPGEDDKLITWFDTLEEGRWPAIKRMLELAIDAEGVIPEPAEDVPQWASELLDKVSQVSDQVSRLQSSGVSHLPADPTPSDDEPSDRAKQATARLFAKTQE